MGTHTKQDRFFTRISFNVQKESMRTDFLKCFRNVLVPGCVFATERKLGMLKNSTAIQCPKMKWGVHFDDSLVNIFDLRAKQADNTASVQ